MNSFLRFLALPLLFLVLAGNTLGQSSSAQLRESQLKTQSIQKGEELFAGRVPLRNGGPPCVTCHSVAGLPFPNGGTLAPDLTREYAKLGPEGIDTALQTLFFPAMTPIYDTHALTGEERSDLGAFLEQAGTKPPPRGITPIIVLIPIGGCVILLGLTSAIWRNRLQGVRRKLIDSAAVRGGAHS